MVEINKEPLSPTNDSYIIDPSDLQKWVQHHGFSPEIRDAIQLSLLRQMASAANPNELGITPEAYGLANALLKEKGITVQAGLDFTGSPDAIFALKSALSESKIPVDLIPTSRVTPESIEARAMIDHLRAEALRRKMKDDDLLRLITSKEIIIVNIR